jgi:hypothetical protein
MSLAKSFLAGLAKGGLRENNRRASMMEQRMQELATNNATIARERAQSKYESDYKSAMAEHSKINSLRSEGLIDTEGTYTKKYRDDKSYVEFQNPEVRKAYGGDYDKFKLSFDEVGPRGISSSYKTPDEITRDVSKTYESIAARQRVESSQPVLTNMDKLLMGSKQNQAAPRAVPEIEQSSAMVPQSPREPQEYTSPEFSSQSEYTSVPNAYDAVTGAVVGNAFIKKNSDGTKTNVQLQADGSYSRVNITSVKPVDAEGTKRVSYRNAVDVETGEVLANVFTQTEPDGTISNVQLQEDGSYKRVNVSARATTEEGEKNRNKSPKLNKVQQEGLARYDRNDRVQLLATELAKKEYVGNPKDFVFRNLATIRDVVGATFNLTGDQNVDLENMTNYFNDKLDTQELKDAMGSLSAAAVIKGDIDATTRFLTFATADLYSEGDRLTVTSINAAKDTIDSFISGTLSQDARLSALANQGQDEMSRIVMNHLSEVRDDFSNPLWNSYPNVRSTLESGALMAPSVASGMALAEDVKRLEKSNPSAYAKSISNLKQHLKTTDLSVLSKPVFISRKLGEPVVITYKKNNEGVYNFRLTPIK